MQKGKYIRTPEIREKHRQHAKRDEEHYRWKGDDASYTALHVWARSRLPKPDKCPSCKKEVSLLDLANISQEYKRDITDWEWLCRSCHLKKYHRRLGRFTYIRNKEHKKNMSKILMGRKRSEETKMKLSLIAKKRYFLRVIDKRGRFT